jgi:hypothetical protein
MIRVTCPFAHVIATGSLFASHGSAASLAVESMVGASPGGAA